MRAERLPCYFISHGGGPWPWMREQTGAGYDALAASLQTMAAAVGKPRVILMISAHWEMPAFTVMAHPHPPMVYDYHGFPEHTYQIRYAAPGDPRFAEQLWRRLAEAGLPAEMDMTRGFDHGAFVPLAVAYPQADVPVVQLSLRQGLDPAEHLALGRVLAPLREEGVLIIGSGLSYHNLRAFGPVAREPSAAFDAWLHDCLHAGPAQRAAQLMAWEDAPAARFAHPREEHLLPLMAVVGAAGDDGAVRCYHETGFMGGVSVSSYCFASAA